MKNFKTMMSISLILLLLIFAGCSQTSPQKTEDKKQIADTTTLKIGVMVPLTGDAASYGEGVKKGVELAKNDMGLSNVELIFEDSKCDGKEAVTVANKLISVDTVAAIIGELCSGATLAAVPIAEQQKTVMISPASTAPKLTFVGPYFFRTVPSDMMQGAFGAALVYDKGYRKLAVLYGNEDYGLGFNKVLEEKFPALGGEVVESQAFEAKSTDLRTQITKIKEAKPDAVYLITNSPDSGVAALKQMKELGLEAFVVASEGLKSDDVLKGAGTAAEGMYVTSVSTGSKVFAEKHQTAYNAAPGPFAAQGYDAMMALGLVIKQGATTREQIIQALSGVEFDGVSGHIKFDENGDVSGNYEVYVVKDNAFAAVEE